MKKKLTSFDIKILLRAILVLITNDRENLACDLYRVVYPEYSQPNMPDLYDEDLEDLHDVVDIMIRTIGMKKRPYTMCQLRSFLQ